MRYLRHTTEKRMAKETKLKLRLTILDSSHMDAQDLQQQAQSTYLGRLQLIEQSWPAGWSAVKNDHTPAYSIYWIPPHRVLPTFNPKLGHAKLNYN